MSIALQAPARSPLAAFIKSPLSARGFSGFEGVVFISGVKGGATFTVNASTDIVTCGDVALSCGNDTAVRVKSTGTLPAPLAENTTYYLRDVTSSTFKLAATAGGAAIDLTDTGTGTHRISNDWDNIDITSTTVGRYDPETGLLYDVSTGLSGTIVWFELVGTVLYCATTSEVFKFSESSDTWSTTGTGDNMSSGGLRGLVTDGTVLIAYGTETGPNANLRQYNGTAWSDYGTQPTGQDIVAALFLDGVLYAAIATASNLMKIGKKTGSGGAWTYSATFSTSSRRGKMAIWNDEVIYIPQDGPDEAIAWDQVDGSTLRVLSDMTAFDEAWSTGPLLADFIKVTPAGRLILFSGESTGILWGGTSLDPAAEFPALPVTDQRIRFQITGVGDVAYENSITVGGSTVSAAQAGSTNTAANNLVTALNASTDPIISLYTWANGGAHPVSGNIVTGDNDATINSGPYSASSGDTNPTDPPTGQACIFEYHRLTYTFDGKVIKADSETEFEAFSTVGLGDGSSIGLTGRENFFVVEYGTSYLVWAKDLQDGSKTGGWFKQYRGGSWQQALGGLLGGSAVRGMFHVGDVVLT